MRQTQQEGGIPVKSFAILALLATALTFTACGDGPDPQPTITPTATNTPQQEYAEDTEFSCSAGPITLISLTIDPAIFDGPVEGFNMIGCFTDASVATLRHQLGIVLSEELAIRNAERAFANSEEVTIYAREFLYEFLANVLGNSYLIINGKATTDQILLIPFPRKKGPTA